MLTKNRIIISALGGVTSLTCLIVLPIVLVDDIENPFSNKETAQYLFGKITSSDYVKFTNKPSFACSLNGNENCDVKFIDSSQIVLVDHIKDIEFSEFVAGSALKKGDYVLIDLKKEYEINTKNETITSESKAFNVEFQKINDITKATKQKLIKPIQDSKRLATIKNNSTEHAKSHYAIVKMPDLDTSYKKFRNVILKTIEEQKIANGNKNATEHINTYRWQNQKKGVLYYEFAEIYEITDKDAVEQQDIGKLDKENNLIQSLYHLESLKNEKWLKMVFSDTTIDPDLELFDLRYGGNLVFEGTIKSGNCFKRTASSNSLVPCN